MKRVWVMILCAVSVAAFAQQPAGGQRSGGQGFEGMPPPSAEQIEAMKKRMKEMGVSQEQIDAMEARMKGMMESEAATPEPAAETNDSQENYDEIMGNFSDLATRFSEEDESDLELFVYDCEYISAEAFEQAMEPFLTVNGEISGCEDSDLVVITDDSDRLPQLKQIAEAIDRPVRQVLVSASVAEFQITDDFEKDVSVQYNQFLEMGTLMETGGGSDAVSGAMQDVGDRVLDAIFPSGGNPASLSGQSSAMYYDADEQALVSGFITFMEQNGTAQILSAPSLVMRRGHSASILSGEDIPITESNVGSGGTSYSVNYKSVGIKLQVTPESIFEDRVVLEVSPEVSNIIRYEESGAGRNPVVAIRNASTKLEINDGFMVSIGGLIREEEIESVAKVPLLGNLPLVGWLFRNTSSEKIRSQLVIFLSVNIVDPSALNADTVSGEIPQELRERVKAAQETMPPEKSNLWTGIKNIFR